MALRPLSELGRGETVLGLGRALVPVPVLVLALVPVLTLAAAEMERGEGLAPEEWKAALGPEWL
jgi:hypothetical protein